MSRAPKFANVGDVFLAPLRGGGSVFVKVAVAAGTSARVVNPGRKLDGWVALSALRVVDKVPEGLDLDTPRGARLRVVPNG